jgi:hypothetical protein
MTCTDDCRFYFTGANKFAKDADASTYNFGEGDQAAYIYGGIGWRKYHLDPSNSDYNNFSSKKYQSDWFELEEGEYYPIESFSPNRDRSELTISVEYEKEDTTTHHHSLKEIQKLEINNEYTFEEYDITVSNPNKGARYQLIFFNPNYDESVKGSMRHWTSDWIYDNYDGWRMCWRIQWYYHHFHGGIRCSSTVKYMNDADKEVSKSDATKWVYRVKATGLFNAEKSFSNWNIAQAGASSKVTIGDLVAATSPPI